MQIGPRSIHLLLLELARNDKTETATKNLLKFLREAFVERAENQQEEDMLLAEFQSDDSK